MKVVECDYVLGGERTIFYFTSQIRVDFRDLVRHLAAGIGAGIREVDDIGRLDDMSFAGILADIKPGSISAVVDRVSHHLLDSAETLDAAGGIFRIAAIEMLSSSHTSDVILDAAERLLLKAVDNGSSTAQL